MRRVPADQVLDDAIAWQLRLGSGAAGPADHDEFHRWLDGRPEHGVVWQRLQALDQALGPAARAPERQAVVHAAPGRSRRRTAGTLTALVLLAGLGAVMPQTDAWQQWLAEHRTATGERRSLTLADGSRLQLNTGSAVDVAFDGQRRTLRLLAGEIAVETASPPPGQSRDPRPFVVQTPQGELRALGTRFLVRLDESRTKLTVLRDAVAACPARCGGPEQAHPAEADCALQRVIRQGQTAQLERDRVHHVTQAVPDADAWRDGVLLFDNARLADVVAEFARYRRGHLGVHSSLADRRVSGTFHLDATDHSLEALLRGLSTPAAPLHLRRFTPWWVDIEPGTGR